MATNKNIQLYRYAVATKEYRPASGIDILKKGASKLVEEVQARIRAKERRYRYFDSRRQK